jgi:hypothetical protein
MRENERDLIQKQKTSMEAAIRQVTQKYEAEINTLRQKMSPPPRSNIEELGKLTQQLVTERREKSRLEADNLILVERLKQNMRKRSPVVHHICVIIIM